MLKLTKILKNNNKYDRIFTVKEKKYFKTKEECKVTLTLPVEAANEANKVVVVGDFNDWSDASHPMKKYKSGEYKVSLSLEKCKEYHSDIQEMTEKYNKLLGTSKINEDDYANWDVDLVCDWIISLEKDYEKYEEKLRAEIKSKYEGRRNGWECIGRFR